MNRCVRCKKIIKTGSMFCDTCDRLNKQMSRNVKEVDLRDRRK